MIVVDVETQNFFTSVNDDGVLDFSGLKISFAGAYDSVADKSLSYWEKDLPALEDLMKNGDTVIGYNIWSFDYGVLSRYFKIDPWTLPTIDLMIAMKKAIGFRPKLDNLAKANFGEGKIGKGSDAIVYWENGELDKLEKYCLEDVRLTYEVWKLGQETGKLKYYDRNGFIKETSVNWKDGFQQKADLSAQGTLF